MFKNKNKECQNMKLWQQLVVIVISKWHKNWSQYYIEMEGWKEVGNNECIQQNKQFYWSGVCVFHNEAFCYSHVILFLCVVCVITNSLIHLSAFDNCYMLSLKHHDFKYCQSLFLNLLFTLFWCKAVPTGSFKITLWYDCTEESSKLLQHVLSSHLVIQWAQERLQGNKVIQLI